MLVDNISNQVKTGDIVKIDPIPTVVDFIESHLPALKKLCKNKGYNEEQITQELTIYLSKKAAKKGMPFVFFSEYRDKKNLDYLNKRIDISVIAIENDYDTDAFFVIEAKRLPAPKPAAREREYVIGEKHNGGIERIKRDQHGKALSKCGIIGYVENDSFDNWESKINDWINKLATENKDTSITWDKNEVLRRIKSSGDTRQLQSENIRDKSTVSIIHLWIDLCE
jgi:hypothetical protein